MRRLPPLKRMLGVRQRELEPATARPRVSHRVDEPRAVQLLAEVAVVRFAADANREVQGEAVAAALGILRLMRALLDSRVHRTAADGLHPRIDSRREFADRSADRFADVVLG